MSPSQSPSPRPGSRQRLAAPAHGRPTPDDRTRALEQARDCVLRAPAVFGTRPWLLEPHPDRLVLRADPARQQTAPEPTERLLVQSAGTALFTARVALAARGWATHVDRLHRTDDPDLLAEIRPSRGVTDSGLAALEPDLRRRPARGRPHGVEQLPEQALRRLTVIAERSGILLVPVVHEAHRVLVARLTHDGAGHPTTVLLATRADDAHAWLRTGEALQHVLLELTGLGRTAVPLLEAVEVPLARVQLRAALTWDAHPQLLLGIGSAAWVR